MGCVNLNPKFQYIQRSSTCEEMPPEGKFTLETMFICLFKFILALVMIIKQFVYVI